MNPRRRVVVLSPGRDVVTIHNPKEEGERFQGCVMHKPTIFSLSFSLSNIYRPT